MPLRQLQLDSYLLPSQPAGAAFKRPPRAVSAEHCGETQDGSRSAAGSPPQAKRAHRAVRSTPTSPTASCGSSSGSQALEPLFTGHVVLARAMNSMLQLAQDTDMTADDNSLVDECQPMPATAATAAYACGPAAGDFAAIPMARTASSGHGQQLPLKSISVVGRSESWPPKRGATVAAAAAAAAMRPSLDVTTAGDTAMECSQPSPTASPPQLYAPTTSGYYAYADYRTGLPRFTSTDSFDGASMFFS